MFDGYSDGAIDDDRCGHRRRNAVDIDVRGTDAAGHERSVAGTGAITGIRVDKPDNADNSPLG